MLIMTQRKLMMRLQLMVRFPLRLKGECFEHYDFSLTTEDKIEEDYVIGRVGEERGREYQLFFKNNLLFVPNTAIIKQAK